MWYVATTKGVALEFNEDGFRYVCMRVYVLTHHWFAALVDLDKINDIFVLINKFEILVWFCQCERLFIILMGIGEVYVNGLCSDVACLIVFSPLQNILVHNELDEQDYHHDIQIQLQGGYIYRDRKRMR